ncbi:VacJ family lipoprotein [Luteimonas yindakuii]|uniref:MlaA family lipoprotein n=1 Tax=Luteimonas yindakuii TaxID=2565782 RepID=UPI0010A48C82|nr:VacJ family lipoprotein [Luteimonas yindakuii]QCO66666.1 VacJ family lipoprotein [Luteimonas yindakuii]
MSPSRILLPCLLLSLAACAGGQQTTRAPAPSARPVALPAGLAAPVDAATGTQASPVVDDGMLDAETADVALQEGAYRDDTGGEPVLAPTEAELDYAVLYGEEPYDPVADPTLPDPAQMQVGYDPWEPFNRRMHRVNDAIDRTVARPLATAYMKVVPRPMRLGVSNFFNNLGQPVSAVNALLQGKPVQAGQALGRFVVNATLGIGGIFDPASDAEIPFRSEDFGQTLGVWGWQNSRYLELPLFGPRTLRDAFGIVGDAPLSPTRQLNDDQTRWALQGLQLVDLRTQLFVVDRMREGAADDYALIRDAWMQRRQYQIFGDSQEGDDALPDYLLDDEALPTVPADAIPVIPGVPLN